MRPKKVIMLFCADENHCAELRFFFHTHGYLVAGIEQPGAGDCGLVVANRVSSPNAARDIAERDRDAPLVVLGRACELKYYPIGSRFVDPKLQNVELLRAIKLAVARKRGPKKKAPGVVVTGENQASQLA